MRVVGSQPAVPNKKELGKLFKKDAKTISDALEAMSECEQLC